MDVNGDHILITDVDLGSLQIVSPGKVDQYVRSEILDG